jgi:hypothetical protein
MLPYGNKYWKGILNKPCNSLVCHLEPLLTTCALYRLKEHDYTAQRWYSDLRFCIMQFSLVVN